MKKFVSLVVVAVFSLTAFVLPFVAPMEAKAYTAPGYNGQILVVRHSGLSYDIYKMSQDGTSQTQLTTATGTDQRPSWSPDGTKIVFISHRDGNGEVYVMNADGTNQTNITNNAGVEYNVNWSPSGSEIVFQTARDGNRELYKINADGTNQVRLTNATGNDTFSAWSPDGTKMAFVSRRDAGDAEIYTMNADGTNQTRLTNVAGADGGGLVWLSTDEIVFRSTRDGNQELYKMNADGTNQTRLTFTTDHEEYVKLSPDGRTISYSLLNDAWNASVFVIHDLETNAIREYDLSQYGANIISDEALWSPDGTKLLLNGFTSDWSAQNHFMLHLDDDSVEPITSDGLSAYSGSWYSIPNSSPVTSSDSLIASYQTPTLANILANDTDEEALRGDDLSISVQPTNGTTSVLDGKVRYTPNNGFVGADSLTYEVCDSFLLDQKCATGVLNITVQAPTAPALVVTKVNGENFSAGTNSYATPSLRPTFSGTASPGAEIRVEIHSDPIILTTTADSSGNWSVTPSFDLPSGEHTVYISATLYGLTTELDSFGLTVGSLANTGESLGWMAFGGISLVGGSAGLLKIRRREIIRARG